MGKVVENIFANELVQEFQNLNAPTFKNVRALK
jgi:hypothetical protein